jgi:hypothetical protein
MNFKSNAQRRCVMASLRSGNHLTTPPKAPQQVYLTPQQEQGKRSLIRKRIQQKYDYNLPENEMNKLMKGEVAYVYKDDKIIRIFPY